MFVEKLTKEDLEKFFTDAISLYSFMSKDTTGKGEEYLYCSYENKNEYSIISTAFKGFCNNGIIVSAPRTTAINIVVIILLYFFIENLAIIFF